MGPDQPEHMLPASTSVPNPRAETPKNLPATFPPVMMTTDSSEGTVVPHQFIPIAEAMRWVNGNAVAIMDWLSRRLRVNVDGFHFRHFTPDGVLMFEVPAALGSAVTRYTVPPGWYVVLHLGEVKIVRYRPW